MCELSNSLNGVAHTQASLASIGALPIAPRILVELQTGLCRAGSILRTGRSSIIEEDPSCASKILQARQLLVLRAPARDSEASPTRRGTWAWIRSVTWSLNEELRKSFERASRRRATRWMPRNDTVSWRHASLRAWCVITRCARPCAVPPLIHDVGQSLFACRMPAEYERGAQESRQDRHESLHRSRARSVFNIFALRNGWRTSLGLWGLPTTNRRSRPLPPRSLVVRVNATFEAPGRRPCGFRTRPWRRVSPGHGVLAGRGRRRESG